MGLTPPPSPQVGLGGPHLPPSPQVGLTFALNSMIYMLASLPMGLLVDHAALLPHR